MCQLVARPVTLVGFTSLCLVMFSGSVVAAGEHEPEHVLFQAIRRADIAILRSLLRRGTPPDVRDGEGTTPLMYASLHGSAEMVELLLKHGADPRAANKRGVTSLLWGARDAKKVRLLISHEADPNARTELGNTPLMVAAGSPSGSAAVEQLLTHGADITTRNKRGLTALQAAATGGNVKTVHLLLAKARELQKLEEVIRDAGPTVAIAANNGFHEIVKLLLEHGADPNRSSGSRGDGLNKALMAGHTDIARTLILHGANLGRRSKPGDTPTVVLGAYTELDDPSLVQFLRGARCRLHRAPQ